MGGLLRKLKRKFKLYYLCKKVGKAASAPNTIEKKIKGKLLGNVKNICIHRKLEEIRLIVPYCIQQEAEEVNVVSCIRFVICISKYPFLSSRPNCKLLPRIRDSLAGRCCFCAVTKELTFIHFT